MTRAILALTLTVAAAAADHPCEAPSETDRLIRAWRITYDDMRLDREQRLAPARRAIEVHPTDIFLHRVYQDQFLSYLGQTSLAEAVARYRKLATEAPGDTVRQYLLARMLWGTDTGESLAIVDRVIAVRPEFPWAYLVKARAHQHEKHKDEGKVRQAVERFFELCPSSLDTEPYRTFARVLPAARRLDLAVALRARIASTDTVQAAAMFPTLWQLEFERPPAEHDETRRQVARDLERLRQLDATELLDAMAEGYRIAGDQGGSVWVRQQMNERLPHSMRTLTQIIRQWQSDRQRPTQEDSREKVEGYFRELLAATDEWIRRWPLDPAPWNRRFEALQELPSEPVGKLVEAGEGLLRAETIGRQNYFVPPGLMVAGAWLDRGAGADRVADLFDREAEGWDERLAADLRSDWIPASFLDQDRQARQDTEWRGRWLLVRAAVRNGDTELTTKFLTAMETAFAGVDFGQERLSWLARLHLARAYLDAGRTEPAGKLLATMREWLDARKPSETTQDRDRRRHIERESWHAELAGRLAEAEGRTSDAIDAYQTTIRLRAFWDTLAARFETIDRTRTLWITSGRSESTWNDWLARGSKTIDTAGRWSVAERRFPEFELVDMNGRKWTLADLKGKRTFINFWATWCGPCITELPWVEKLHARLKDHKDAQVLTINADENRALVEPFLRQRSFTFAVLPARDFAMGTLKVNGYPTSWIVDATGVVRVEQLGFVAEPARWMEDVLEKLKAK